MIGKNLAQEECNWPSKFQGMDFNIIKILSVPFNKVCPPGPFLVPASLNWPLFFKDIYGKWNRCLKAYSYTRKEHWTRSTNTAAMISKLSFECVIQY